MYRTIENIHLSEVIEGGEASVCKQELNIAVIKFPSCDPNMISTVKCFVTLPIVVLAF